MKKINFLLGAIMAAGLLQACTSSNSGAASNSPLAADSSKVTNVKSDSSAPKMDTNSNVSADTAFASKAAISGMAEVALGKMASEKGANAKIINFGKMMITDHGKANAELMSIAKSKNLTLPAKLDAEHQAKSDSLSKLSGKDFDIAYVKAMVEGHQKTLALMESEITGGKDTELKAFAAKTAPVVKMHLTEITKIQAGIR